MQVWHIRSPKIPWIPIIQTLSSCLINFEHEQSRPQTINRILSEIRDLRRYPRIITALAATDFKEVTEQDDYARNLPPEHLLTLVRTIIHVVDQVYWLPIVDFFTSQQFQRFSDLFRTQSEFSPIESPRIISYVRSFFLPILLTAFCDGSADICGLPHTTEDEHTLLLERLAWFLSLHPSWPISFGYYTAQRIATGDATAAQLLKFLIEQQLCQAADLCDFVRCSPLDNDVSLNFLHANGADTTPLVRWPTTAIGMLPFSSPGLRVHPGDAECLTFWTQGSRD
jgi:hypothetical protein